MKHDNKKNLKYIIAVITGLIVALILGSFVVVSEYRIMKENVSSTGGPDPFFNPSNLSFGLVLFALALCSILLGSMGLLVKRCLAISLILLSFGFFSLFIVKYGYSNYVRPVRMNAFQELGERLMPLINAIERYRVENETIFYFVSVFRRLVAWSSSKVASWSRFSIRSSVAYSVSASICHSGSWSGCV